MFSFRKLGPSLYSLIVEKTLRDKLGAAGLNCEVILGEGDFRFSWVAILCDKVTGVTGQHYVIYLTLSTFGHIYRFADISKMIGERFTCIFCRLFRFVYD